MRMIKTFLRLTLKQKLIIPQIWVLMFWYNDQVHRKPFSELSPKIGTLQYQTPQQPSPQVAWSVQEVMESMFCQLKWKDACLIRALTAKKLLNRMGECCTLYMGVRKVNGEAMTAHAWLRCGRLIVTGREHMADCTVTACFGDES